MRYCLVMWGQKGIRVENSSPSFAHCKLYYNLEQGIRAQNTFLYFDSSEVCYNDQSGIVIYQGTPHLRGNSSHDNQYSGLVLEGVYYGEVLNCNLNNNQQKGLYCSDGTYGVEIGYNVMNYNSMYGLHLVQCDNQAHPLNIHHNQIFQNVLDGIYSDQSYSNLINNTITDNQRDGVFCYQGDLTLYNNIIDRNDNRGIFIQIVPLIIDYNDVWNNSVADYLGCSAGIHDISEDPLYISVSNHNYNLQAISPCIDAGNPLPTYNDPDGTRNDMGALYFNQSPVENFPENFPPKDYTILKCYPNPFNQEIIIEILPTTVSIQEKLLSIYDILGREVYEFKINSFSGGKYIWNGTDFNGKALASGIYWCRLDKTNVLKLVLLR
jgi:hypothetical protein